MSTANLCSSALELWGGVECTVNRVRDGFLDQLELTGHAWRRGDLQRVADLGIKAIRYPVLWERTSPNFDKPPDWSWPDERLTNIREVGIRPIVGLVHHGSGPRHTSLIDPEFAPKLAKYAEQVAARYPWVTDYTPVNEPLTTARFSGLYGHWYPHGRDDFAFVRVLLNECRGTVLAMQAIRRLNPGARLVQTDDLGFTSSSPKLEYQASFENERRWLGFDLLCGRVDQRHPLWSYLLHSGAMEAELFWFQENSSPPDLMGLNYYLSSERFLHEKLFLYPRHLHGGNYRDRYVDVETARVRAEGLIGVRELVLQAWRRCGIPIAITECHNGCTREEQLRWLQEVWSGCLEARNAGADVRALTVWSLFGVSDWDSLVTQERGHYESGAFDVRSPEPRSTAVALWTKHVAAGRSFAHPLVEIPGWWRRPGRLMYGFSVLKSGTVIPARNPQLILSRQAVKRVAPLLITGGRGTLARAFAQICYERGISHQLLTRREMDIAHAASVAYVVEELRPWAIVNCAGFARVDDAEWDQESCYRENTVGPEVLANLCRQHTIQLLTFSSDLVFDGAKNAPYVESDCVAPLNVYGKNKVRAEQAVLEILPEALVVRTSAFFGLWDEHNFVTRALRALAAGEPFVAADDCIVSPTYVPDLVQQALDLLIDREQGIVHLANDGALSWYEFALRAAEMAKINSASLIASTTGAMGLSARRPANSALSSERMLVMPMLEHALERYIRESEVVLQCTRGIVAA